MNESQPSISNRDYDLGWSLLVALGMFLPTVLGQNQFAIPLGNQPASSAISFQVGAPDHFTTTIAAFFGASVALYCAINVFREIASHRLTFFALLISCLVQGTRIYLDLKLLPSHLDPGPLVMLCGSLALLYRYWRREILWEERAKSQAR